MRYVADIDKALARDDPWLVEAMRMVDSIPSVGGMRPSLYCFFRYDAQSREAFAAMSEMDMMRLEGIGKKRSRILLEVQRRMTGRPRPKRSVWNDEGAIGIARDLAEIRRLADCVEAAIERLLTKGDDRG